ncbi:MAG TPA: ABC transporter permease [Vicinamibacterales bacterium]
MSMLADIRYAARLAVNEWRFTLTLIATLATGIAASGAIFNVVNASLLRPLPIADESRVFRLRDYTENPGGQRVLRSNRVPNFLSIRDEARSFSSAIGLYRVEWSLIDGDTPLPIKTTLMSPGSLQFLGARIHRGRFFTPGEEEAGLDANAIVLSHSFWRQHFGGRDDVIGSTVRIENRLVTVIGVVAPGFRFPYDAEAWMPERFSPAAETSLAVFARLAPGVTRQQAEQELDAIAIRAEAARPIANRGVRFAMVPVREEFAGGQSRTMLALMAAAILLLVLASANVANLLLARGIRRAREVAVRTALGASRARQLRQMLIESVMFAAMGTAVGLAVAAPLSRSVSGLIPNTLRDQFGLAKTMIDWRAAVFAAVIIGAVGIAAGLLPALKISRADVTSTLRESSRGVSGGHRIMRLLVVGEVALASVLLISAGLMVDNFQRLMNTDLGLEADQLISIRLPLPPRYDTAERRIVLARQLNEAAIAVPGTRNAAIVSINPLDRGSFGAAVESEDAPLAPGQSAPVVNHRLVTPGWFATAQVPLLFGRVFTSSDHANSEPVAIISSRMANRLWPEGQAVGKRVRQARPQAPWLTVIGVVGDVRDTGEWKETWYLPYEQHAATLAASTMNVMLRSSVDAAATLSAMREKVRAIDPLLPVPEPSLMTTLWENAAVEERMSAVASTLFGLSGLLLAALGTYGVLAYLVSARAREFGIRQALGATPSRVLAMVLRDGAVLVMAGLAVGGVLSIAAIRGLQSAVTGTGAVPPSLPWIVGALLIGTALAASLMPARRATRVSPVDVMRSE